MSIPLLKAVIAIGNLTAADLRRIFFLHGHCFQRWLTAVLACTLVATVLHADMVYRQIAEPDGRSALPIPGPRSGLGDNYYMTMLKHARERLDEPAARPEDSDQADLRYTNAITATYAPALDAGYFLFSIANWFAIDSRWAALITSILHTAVLAFGLLIFLYALKQDMNPVAYRRLPMLEMFVGMVFVDAFGTSIFLGRPFWSGSLLTYYSNSTRLINPTIFWFSGLVAATAIMIWTRQKEKSVSGTALVTLICGAVGAFSISNSAVITGALLVYCAWECVKTRSFRLAVIIPLLGSTIGLVWALIEIRAYNQSQLGNDLRHGVVGSLVFKWQYLALMLTVPLIIRRFSHARAFVAGLILAASCIGLICASFHLGDRLWLRGGQIYVWAIVVAIASHMLSCQIASTALSAIRRKFFTVAFCISLTAFVIIEQAPSTRLWNGYVTNEKWHQLEWIDKHLPAGSVIASPDIEDPLLLAIYTDTRSLFSYYGLTNANTEQILTRFFYNMQLYGQDRQYLDLPSVLGSEDEAKYLQFVKGPLLSPLLGETVDQAIFSHLVLYLSFQHGLSQALTDREQQERLIALLHKAWETASRSNYAIDFAVAKTDRVPAALSGWEIIHDTGTITILRNPRSPFRAQ